MQTAFSYLGIKEFKKQNKPKSKLKTTSRDLEILYFILEMKFSNIHIIHQKFFSTTRFGLKSCSFDYTRQRLGELVRYGLIEKVDTFLKTGLYQTTQKGYFLLCNSNLQKLIPKPSFGVDIRTFDHDLKVSNIRVELEQCDKAKNWISERSICEDEKYRSLFTNEFRPDAIYTCPNGSKVAFELELSRKSKDRYKQKLNRYIQVMTNPVEDSRIFAKVHYVFKDLKLLEYVKSETQLYQPLFIFSLESEFLSKTENI
ncbi:MAG: replication-relaxation family protein [Bdellovibrionaceae bacterium]|nr:replication-relaxation family protein [Pseudobdellovibrionaceae bacterium]